MSTSYTLRAAGPTSLEDFAKGVGEAFGLEATFHGDGEWKRFEMGDASRGVIGFCAVESTDPDPDSIVSEGHVWSVTINQDEARNGILRDGPILQAARPSWSIRADEDTELPAEWPAAVVPDAGQ